MLKLEKNQYQNSIFQLNYTRFEQILIIRNYLLQKDLQIFCFIFNVNVTTEYIVKIKGEARVS